jgi:hypothetical protein
MDDVVKELPVVNQAKHTVEVVVHIADTLDATRRAGLAAALAQNQEIVSAEFCPTHFHLMLVRYDRMLHSSQDIIRVFDDQKINARLIGPI